MIKQIHPLPFQVNIWYFVITPSIRRGECEQYWQFFYVLKQYATAAQRKSIKTSLIINPIYRSYLNCKITNQDKSWVIHTWKEKKWHVLFLLYGVNLQSLWWMLFLYGKRCWILKEKKITQIVKLPWKLKAARHDEVISVLVTSYSSNLSLIHSD